MISATASEKREVLQAITFGKPTAEEEGKDLSAYFVETDQWHKIFAGDIDVVYGPKGAGKSALYALLLSRTSELFDRGIIVVPAENPRGAVAFRDLVSNPPADESEFRNLWKLFFLVLLAHTLRDYGISSAHLQKVIDCLEEARLLPRNVSLHALLRSASSYVRRIMRGDAVAFETTLGVDPMNSAPSLTGRIRFVEPTGIEESLGCVSVEQLLEWTNLALEEAGFRVWLVLDRLDVAFAESADLERNALRALFRVYLDLRRFNAIALKIFLRTDIWMNILRGGFREASHISSQMTISWDEASLLNLVIRRAIHNKALREFYAVEVQDVLADRGRQVELFYRIFPRRVPSKEQARSFEWILQNTCDGSRRNSPRELIHLLSVAQRLQLRRMEIGQAPPDGESLFESPSLLPALPEVSRVRFEQTLCAEYPQLRERMQQLENEKSLQTAGTLATIWGLNLHTALETAYQLVDIGFFQFKGTRHSPEFKVPLLYQRALKMRSLG
ncbi:MAG TPA: hypothetical protein VGI36_07180 [Candidatus Binataceae bacterium]